MCSGNEAWPLWMVLSLLILSSTLQTHTASRLSAFAFMMSASKSQAWQKSSSVPYNTSLSVNGGCRLSKGKRTIKAAPMFIRTSAMSATVGTHTLKFGLPFTTETAMKQNNVKISKKKEWGNTRWRLCVCVCARNRTLTYLISSSTCNITQSLQRLFRYHPLIMDRHQLMMRSTQK